MTTASPPPATATLFVGNLNHGATVDEIEQALVTLARRLGLTPEHCKVPTDPQTSRPRGYAFLRLASPAEAADGLMLLEGRELLGRGLRVSPAKPDPRAARETRR